MKMISDLKSQDQVELLEKSLWLLEVHLTSWKEKLDSEHFSLVKSQILTRLAEVFPKGNEDKFVAKCIRHLKDA